MRVSKKEMRLVWKLRNSELKFQGDSVKMPRKLKKSIKKKLRSYYERANIKRVLKNSPRGN